MKRFRFNIGPRLFVIALTFLVAVAGFSSVISQQRPPNVSTSPNSTNGSTNITINDVRIAEGNSGTRIATFTVSSSSFSFAQVQYATADGTATGEFMGTATGESNSCESCIGGSSDYIHNSGTLFFGGDSAGVQTRTIQVAIKGDVNKEPNETFFVNLSNPVGATITDSQGIGIIVDEDRAYIADFDRDLKTDFSVFRPIDEFKQQEGYWYIFQSSNNVIRYYNFGLNGDHIVPGDYDADGITDFGVFRPADGVWTIQNSSNSFTRQVQWGAPNDKTVQADYNGDDMTDVAVFRDGIWYIIPSSASQPEQPRAIAWGTVNDRPVPGDFDGDGFADFTVYRDGVWFVQPNTDGMSYAQEWGLASDIPVAGDFDGDGSSDIAVFRPSNGVWYIISSLNGQLIVVQWGALGDLPVVGDYDADGISDIAVWRPDGGQWYVLLSSNPPGSGGQQSLLPPTPVAKQWGQVGDKPVPHAYVPEQ